MDSEFGSSEPDTKPSTEVEYALQSTFLSELDSDEKVRVFDLTTRISRELNHWAARYPLIRRVRVWPVCLSVVASARFVPINALHTMGRVGLWLFTIDDLFDEEIVPVVELQRRVVRYKEIVSGAPLKPRGERDTLAYALHDIQEELKQYPLYDKLREKWAEAVSRTLDAMMRENEWRAAYKEQGQVAKLPDYDTYLGYSLYSAGVPLHVSAALIAINDHSVLNHLSFLGDMEQSAALCVRLANDLQTYTKELGEGKMNTIVLAQREVQAQEDPPQDILGAAYSNVRLHLQRERARCEELRAQARTVSGQPEALIGDTVRFVCDFYAHHDYHTFPYSTGR